MNQELVEVLKNLTFPQLLTIAIGVALANQVGDGIKQRIRGGYDDDKKMILEIIKELRGYDNQQLLKEIEALQAQIKEMKSHG